MYNSPTKEINFPSIRLDEKSLTIMKGVFAFIKKNKYCIISLDQ